MKNNCFAKILSAALALAVFEPVVQASAATLTFTGTVVQESAFTAFGTSFSGNDVGSNIALGFTYDPASSSVSSVNVSLGGQSYTLDTRGDYSSVSVPPVSQYGYSNIYANVEVGGYVIAADLFSPLTATVGGVTGYGSGGLADVSSFPPAILVEGTFTSASISAVPEPSTWAMMMLGFAGLGFAGSRRNKAARIAV